jgi:hypothetical protein
MRLWFAALLSVYLVCVPVGPAQAGHPPASPSAAEQSEEGDAPAGVQPVDPGRFVGKVEQLGDWAYTAASPVMDTAVKVVIAAAGVLFFLVIIGGVKMFLRAIAVVATAALGLALWHSAPRLVETIKGLAAWLTS